VYDYVTKLCKTPPEVILNNVNSIYLVLGREKPGIGIIKGLNIAAVRLTTLQVNNCSFRVVA
jgi:hypothetical protein